MKHAFFLTAYDRPHYLHEALESWRSVRGIERWRFVARVEPGPRAQESIELFEQFFYRIDHPDFEVMLNPERYGVLHHPWVGFEQLFAHHDFVARGEDDLVVSADILEYFEWAAREFKDIQGVATVNAYHAESGHPTAVSVREGFNPLTWGTWRDRWRDYIGPTWDHDYSTFNDYPGHQAGWDWNLNTRIMPERGLCNVYPLASRVHNIGLVGTHSTPENYASTASFEPDYGEVRYNLVL